MFASTSAEAEERLRNLLDTTDAEGSCPTSTGAVASLEVCSSEISASLVVGNSATTASALCTLPSSPASGKAVTSVISLAGGGTVLDSD